MLTPSRGRYTSTRVDLKSFHVLERSKNGQRVLSHSIFLGLSLQFKVQIQEVQQHMYFPFHQRNHNQRSHQPDFLKRVDKVYRIDLYIISLEFKQEQDNSYTEAQHKNTAQWLDGKTHSKDQPLRSRYRMISQAQCSTQDQPLRLIPIRAYPNLPL